VSDFERCVEQLQRKIEEQERALYSARVIEHARNPQNFCPLESADGFAAVTGWCGDTMKVYLRLDEGGRIGQAGFITDGCGPTLACGSMMTVLVRGLSPEKALLISVDQLINALDGLPAESGHCAELTVNALRAAVADLPKV
jgi:nitrogen fixation NifU-like protein